MCAISAYILKIVENDPFLRLQMRAKEMVNAIQTFESQKLFWLFLTGFCLAVPKRFAVG